MKKEIRHSWFYNHPPEKVWAYLTKPELIEQWLMKTDFDPVIGKEFKFFLKPMPDFGLDGIIHCKVLELVPFKKLSYSWKSGPGEGRITTDSIVVWTLHPDNNGTELLLVHSGVDENNPLYSMMNEGWRQNIKKIETRINETL